MKSRKNPTSGAEAPIFFSPFGTALRAAINHLLAAGTVEFFHKVGQGLDVGRADGVVQRGAHATYGSMARRADQSGSGGLFGEIFFERFVAGSSRAAANAKNDVHQRARSLLDGAVVKAAARVDRVVGQPGLRFITLLNAGQPAFRGDPFGDEPEDVHSKSRRRVVQGLLLDVRAVLQNRGQTLVRAFGQVLAHDHQSDAAGAEVFLRAGEDQPEFGNLDRPRSDVRGHIRHQRRGGGGQRVILRAFDGVVGAEIGVRGVGREVDFFFAWDARELYAF